MFLESFKKSAYYRRLVSTKLADMVRNKISASLFSFRTGSERL